MKTLSSQALGYLKRADSEQLKSIFEKYASTRLDDELYMTDEDFLVKFLKIFPEKNFNKDSAKLLCGILDTSKDKIVFINIPIGCLLLYI